MNIERNNLSDGLKKIYDYEIEHGNTIDYIDEFGWENCKYSIVFKNKLFSIKSKDQIVLPDYIEYWECNDPHYSIEAGFFCNMNRHAIVGPK